MPIKEKIIEELKKAPQKFKKLKVKFKASKKFLLAMEELHNQGVIEEVNGFIKLTVNKEQTLLKGKKAVEEKTVNPDNLQGLVVKLTENYGFVRAEGVAKDIFVAGKFMMGSIVGDKVELAKIPSKRHQFEGEVVAILEEKKNMVATIEKKLGKMVATLQDSPTLSLPIEISRGELKSGDVVLVDVLGRGRGHRSLVVKVRENIGKITDSQKSSQLILVQKNITPEFEPQVIKEANDIISRLDYETEYKHREDLTGKVIFTIDSAKTKDIDDAISVEKIENGYNLSVHIADVSHFVRPASFNNQVAFNRGTSIYFGDSVIPMLPKEFSNDVCSLNEGVVRLAFTCDIKIDDEGNVQSYKFYKSIIKSRLKGVYSEINSILNGKADKHTINKYSEVIQTIENADSLYNLLDKKRTARGAMDIDSDEAQILFDKNKKVVDIVKRQRGKSEKIIEECMLLANFCAANLAKKAGIPFVYRTHAQPDSEKIFLFKENLKRFGLRIEIKKGETLQQALSRILDQSRKTEIKQFVHTGVLRCQSKAVYSDIPQGHFGLSLDDYAHFTSPIRRFPDLAIHRILTDFINGVPKERIIKKYEKFANAASEQASKTELEAMQLERQITDIYKAEYMQSRIGETYNAVVTGVTNFGVYVALDNTVEGLVHVSLLDMVTPVLHEGFNLSCSVTGKKYQIGDKVNIKVIGADIFNGHIDFQIINK